MNVMVVGSGGREHALAWKLNQSPTLTKLYVAPGNAGTESLAENLPIAATDINKLRRFAKLNKIDLTIVGPDDPLALGIVDAFTEAKLRIFGPSQSAAQIEASKAFAKRLMQAEAVPTADYKVFDSHRAALLYLKKQTFPLFVKASGLVQGKGAIECRTLAEAEETIDNLMIKKQFARAGETVVIESYLDGYEFSLHALCDGNNYLLLPAAQDHKPIFDGDKGPNTGGMGAVTPLPWLSEKIDQLSEQMIAPILAALKTQGTPFKGLLYPGIKMTSQGPKVLEYNARFGDPEAEVYCRILESDLLELILACVDGNLQTVKLRWSRSRHAVDIVLTSAGYPNSSTKAVVIDGLAEAEAMKDVIIFHGATTNRHGRLETNGGRILHVTATGSSLTEAQTKAYQAVDKIQFAGKYYRHDIGDKAIRLNRK